MKKILYVALVSILYSTTAFAQDNITQMAVDLPQSMSLNPAQRPSRSFVSIPIIGSIDFSASNSFSYNDVISKRSDGNYIDIASMVATSAASGNMMLGRFNMDIVNVGFYVSQKDFINITVRGRVHGATNYPLGLLEFVSDNNLAQARSYDVNMSPNALAWAEVGVGYSRSIGNFTAGVRFKYLAGVVGAQSPQGVNFDVDKSYDKYMISADYAINLGGLGMSNSGGVLFNSGVLNNSGFAVDLGMTWLSDDERISVSASVSDLGRIWWSKDNSITLQAREPGRKFQYDGLGNLLDQDLDFNTLMDSVLTGFTQAVGMDTLTGVGFSTPMPTTFQAMGSYALGRRLQHNVSLGFIGSLPYRGGFDYAISAGYAYRSPNGIWQLMTNYTYRSNNPINIGLGAVMTTGVFQLFLATDNVISFFSAPQSRNVSARLGINFFFGSNRL